MKTKNFILENTLRAVVLIIIFLLMSSVSFSQTTGSIGGSVFDDSDNSPLPGASIKIVGSNQGAITNGYIRSGSFIHWF
jgi:hypothetical protein